MASVALGVVGAGLGALVAGPLGATALVGASMGWSIGITLGGVLFAPRQEPQERGRLDDVRITGSGFGVPLPYAYGRARVGGNVIWAKPLEEQKRSQEQGGKWGGQRITTYRYFGSFAVAVCQGPIDRIRRIWAEDLLIYDASKDKPTDFDIRIYTGTEDQEPDELIELTEGADAAPGYRGLCYVVFERLPLRQWANRLPVLTFEVENFQGGANITLARVLEDLFERVGLAPEDYDVAAATDPVAGLVVAQRQSVRQILESPLRVFTTDLVEVDGQIQAVRRGGASVGTLAWEDLGATVWDGGAGDAPQRIQWKRLQDLELPSRIDLSYFSTEKHFEQATQSAIRQAKEHVQDAVTIQTPLAMSEDAARRKAELILYQQWAERDQAEVVLPPRYLKYAPGDVVQLALSDTSTVRVRIVGMNLEPFGPISMTLVRDDDQLLTQIVAGGDIGSIDDTFVDPSTLAVIAWSGNALDDEEADHVGFYMVAAGNESWAGVTPYVARGNGYQPRARIEESATYGQTLTALPAGLSTAAWDRVNTLDVELNAGSVQGNSTDAVLAGANLALVGNELIHFLTVDVLGTNQYRLSGLLRGQRGTDYAWGDHAVGDRFVLIEPGTLHRFRLPRSLINKSVKLKAIGAGETLGEVEPISVLITGAELKPYAPVHIRGERDLDGNLTITWVRRARKNGEMEDSSDVELDEKHERYRVEIMDGATVKRPFEVTTPTCTYTADDQEADFGSPQSAVTVRIYQRGDFKGGTNTSRMLGYPGSATV